MNYLARFYNEAVQMYLSYSLSTLEGIKVVIGLIIIVLLILQQKQLNALEKKVEKIITG
ncbi:MAG TPA: hypothetical protein VK541_14750 [Pedobacter sp.]|uniref:hypothetical protein n=1 Tax=Pedobacter sp. TaxID=1411316 RepID=UPI002C5609D3|nr:hypothetical protein [Pedobacter sp.]HMI03740.1 hypothetical protein [Pedobacter sp.]